MLGLGAMLMLVRFLTAGLVDPQPDEKFILPWWMFLDIWPDCLFSNEFLSIELLSSLSYRVCIWRIWVPGVEELI